MAEKITQEMLVEAPIDRFFELVVDYERYPEFVPSLKAAKVTSAQGSTREVEYQLDLGIKKIRYTLRHVEERPKRVHWSLVGGDMMKVSNGSWELSEEGGKTRARYTVEIQIAKPALVPQAIVDKISDELAKVQLPKMMDAFK